MIQTSYIIWYSLIEMKVISNQHKVNIYTKWGYNKLVHRLLQVISITWFILQIKVGHSRIGYLIYKYFPNWSLI